MIADEVKIEIMIESYDRSVEAYYSGFQEFVDISHIQDHCTYELILIMFGYKLVEWFKFAESPEEKELALQTLEKIHVIGNRGD